MHVHTDGSSCLNQMQNGYCTREREWMDRFSSTLTWQDSDDSDHEYEAPDQNLKVSLKS